MEGLPIYKITLDKLDDTSGIDLISLVAEPAIMIKGITLSKICDTDECPLTPFKFSKDRQIVAGPILIPDTLIYRRDEDGFEYYVTFTKEVISEMVIKMKMTKDNFIINLDHKNKIDAYLVSDWIIESDTQDKSKIYGYDLPIGTYFGEVKINDSQIWEDEIKNNEKFGFSIEGFFDLIKLNKITKEKEIKMEDKTQEIMDMIASIDTKYAEMIATINTKFDELKAELDAMKGEKPVEEETVEEVVDEEMTQMKAELAELKTKITELASAEIKSITEIELVELLPTKNEMIFKKLVINTETQYHGR